jgi:hypothetical protein
MCSPVFRSSRLPGVSWGSQRATILYLLWIVCLLSPLARPAYAQNLVNVTTHHNDNARTGQNLNETILTPANVNSTQFGLLFIAPVDSPVGGYVFAQPLYLSNVTIPGQGAHNVVFVATEHDSLYAFDADTFGSPLWHVSFLGTGVTSVPNGDVGTSDIVPEIGITGTPVIDPKAGTLYVVVKTKEANGTSYVQRLHALDVTTGKERTGSPVVIQASVAGVGNGSSGGNLAFSPLRENQRSALLLLNGVVYIAWASHGDNDPYHGWLIGYNATTLQQTAIFNSTPNGTRGGIWQSGGGPAADSSNNIYFLTGNGTFSAPSQGNGVDYGDSFVKLGTSTGNGLPVANAIGVIGRKPISGAPGTLPIGGGGGTSNKLPVLDWFAPSDQSNLDAYDSDMGSGGLLLLPNSVGSIAHPHLLVGAGKEGTIFLVDQNNMGHFTTNANHVVQTVYGQIGGVWGTPAYFNGHIYYAGAGDVLKAFSISNGALSPSPVFQTQTGFSYPGATPSISANGAANGIAWAIQGFSSTAVLHAFNAANLQELYNSTQAANGRDYAGSYVKFTVPTIANGKVYVGTQTGLAVYGLLPTKPPSGPAVLKATSGDAQVILTWTGSQGAISYHIKRSTTDGGPYTTIATGVGSTSFTDSGVTNGTTYHYVVTAVNAGGESAASHQASAIPTSKSN